MPSYFIFESYSIFAAPNKHPILLILGIYNLMEGLKGLKDAWRLGVLHLEYERLKKKQEEQQQQ